MMALCNGGEWRCRHVSLFEVVIEPRDYCKAGRRIEATRAELVTQMGPGLRDATVAEVKELARKA